MDKIIKFISNIVVRLLDNSLDFGVIDDAIHSIYFDFCSCMFDLCQPMLDAVLATTHVKHMGHIGRRRPICSSAQGFNADTAPYVFDLKRGRGGALCGAYSQDGTFSRNDFAYDHQGDTYTCPEGKLLTTRGTLVNDGATMLYRASTFD